MIEKKHRSTTELIESDLKGACKTTTAPLEGCSFSCFILKEKQKETIFDFCLNTGFVKHTLKINFVAFRKPAPDQHKCKSAGERESFADLNKLLHVAE